MWLNCGKNWMIWSLLFRLSKWREELLSRAYSWVISIFSNCINWRWQSSETLRIIIRPVAIIYVVNFVWKYWIRNEECQLLMDASLWILKREATEPFLENFFKLLRPMLLCRNLKQRKYKLGTCEKIFLPHQNSRREVFWLS